MKILLINDYYELGGAELQSRREVQNLIDHGITAFFLTFDKNRSQGTQGNNINLRVSRTIFSKVYNKLFVNFFIKRKIKKILKRIEPDYIHINNVFTCHLTVYKAVKKYKVLQTIRDYGAVCPKATCILEDYTECRGYCNSNCKECIKKKGLKYKFKALEFKRVLKYRYRFVDKFVCPSYALTKKCLDNNYDIVCIKNPFDFSKIDNREKKIQNKTFLYYGMIEEIKGVFRLIDAFKDFSIDKTDVELLFIGKIFQSEEHEFLATIKECKKIKYLGYMKNDDILKKLQDIYCVVVPSLWIENYPNTVLESIASKTLVLGSNRGGIPGMIHESKCLFDVLNKDDIIEKLNYAYSMSDDEYSSIVEKNFDSIKNDNNESYFNSLIKLFKSI